MSVPLRKAARKAHALLRLAVYDLRRECLGTWFPLRPSAISLMVNDICNSRCQMCLIWKNKRTHEITPEELGRVLDEPVFCAVRDVGVTGGEPTLRSDLPEIFRTIAARSHRIRRASIITNAIREMDVTARVLESARICREAGMGFSVMVSLDGLGAVHDTVRGREGNFATAMACVERFKAEGLEVAIGCTVTKSNLAEVDAVLDWAQETGTQARFRVAEFIQRLYNDPQREFIRNFTDLERYHLGLFFFRAETEFEANPAVRKTYRSIRGMLAEGKPRTTGCPYHHDTVILTSRGELLYCSPKSPVLGTVLERGAADRVYFGNLAKKGEIRRQHCDDCIHDYHVAPTFRETLAGYWRNWRRARRFDCRRLVVAARGMPGGGMEPAPESVGKRVLIVGWYGTETTGDKAILAAILARLQARPAPPRQIVVASLFPFVTRRTLQELEVPEVGIVETFSADFIAACERSDEVVVGGGPLMDLEILNHILYAFIAVRRRGGMARIDGCGIGPLVDPLYVKVVGQILRLADGITLRDQASCARCFDEFGRVAEVVEDPATEYVRQWSNANPRAVPARSGLERSGEVACFLREWGAEYKGELTQEQFERRRRDFEERLVDRLAELAGSEGCSLALYPMHTFSVGGDDRRYARLLMRRLMERGVPPNRVAVQRLPLTPSETLTKMRNSRLVVAMRFHSVVFAETLGVPYLAIDYTRGGKIHAFLSNRSRQDRMISVDEIAAGDSSARFRSLLREVR